MTEYILSSEALTHLLVRPHPDSWRQSPEAALWPPDALAQAILALEEDSFTSENLLTATGMSRVSVRKYLKHLTDAQLLEESFHYGQIGRPSFRYRCLDRVALQRLAQG